jgi:hypothetical protein
MSSQAGPTGRTGRLTALYVATWAVLAVAAMAYLGVLAMRSELAARLATSATTELTAAVSSDPAVSDALSQVEGLGRSVAELRTQVGSVKEALARQDEQVREVPALRAEVGDIKTALASHEERQSALSGRLAAFEAQAMAHVAATQNSNARQSSTDIATARPIVTGSLDERTEVLPRPELRASKAESERTERKATATRQAAAATEQAERKPEAPQQAVAAAVPAFGPAKVVSLAGPVALQLGTGSSPDDLRLRWLRVSSSNKATLEKFEPRYAQAKGGNAPVYRLLIGPIASSAEATRLCSQLKARKIACSLTAYTGQPL